MRVTQCDGRWVTTNPSENKMAASEAAADAALLPRRRLLGAASPHFGRSDLDLATPEGEQQAEQNRGDDDEDHVGHGLDTATLGLRRQCALSR